MKLNILQAGAVLWLAILFVSCAEIAEKQYTGPALFNDNWSFKMEASTTFPDVDTLWKEVTLPHTPRIEPLITTEQWQGICRYRKTFHAPSAWKGKKVAIKFEGAMNVADVWLNEKKLAHHLGGFLPFVVDLTDDLKFGSINTLEVRLDNTDNPVTGPKPLEQLDFNTYGGLYRNVYLLVRNSLHITDPMEAGKVAGGGVFVTYPMVSPEMSTIKIKTHIKNDGEMPRSFVIQQRLTRNNNIVMAANSETTTLEPGADQEIIVSMQVQNPLLWSPQTPALYDLHSELITDDGIEDAVKTRIGIRHLEITKDFFKINGQQMFLRGVNRHQEYPFIGYAVSDRAQYRDARKIKEAGFDYVRLSHYPMSPAFMDACDELGLLVLDAIPGWQYFNEDQRFQDYAWSTCRDLVRRDRNHPCVLAWEVSLNESWMPESFIDRATAIAHAEYPGNQCYTAGWQKYGYDIYLQARQHRLEHYETPQKPYIVSEYGDWEYYAMNAGLNQEQWSDLMEEERSSRQLMGSGEKRLLQQATNIQEAHNDNLSTPAFADGYWAMFDYNRGYTNDLEASGIMSINRLPKFSYYFFRSQRDANETSDIYDAGPMVFIASYWMPGSDTRVRVFSNCDEVELQLNGELIARQKPDTGRTSNHLRHPPFTFHLSRFEPGTLKATGYINGDEATTYQVSTPGKPAKLLLSIDKSGRIPVSGVKDAVFVYARLLDENNTVVPQNGRVVNFLVNNDARVLNPEPIETEAGIAAALIRIGKKAGNVTIKAESGVLAPAQMDVVIATPSSPGIR